MEMKRLLIAMLAGMILMACSSDHFLGDPATGKTEVEEPVAIDFGSTARAVTRASHEESAKLLNNKFYIYGAKTSSTGTTNAPFDNYQVQYNASSAGTTDTNSSDWEYNGLTSKKGVPQGIRYWDFSAPKYEFVAAAGLADDEFITNTTDGMRIKVADADALTSIYVSDRITATPSAKAATDETPATKAYGNTVQFQFRRLGARMRVGFYETVPGYAVKDLVFYYIGAPSGSYTVGVGGAFPKEGTYTVSYDDATNAAVSTFAGAYNKMTFTNSFGLLDYTSAASEAGNAAMPYLAADGTLSATPVNAFLGTTSASATYGRGTYTIDGTPGVESDFKPILPNENNTLKMQLRMDYTLVALDGSGEELRIRDAYVSVPIQYLQWKPNYSYTYVFKISDSSNGYTGKGGGGEPTVPGRLPDPEKGGDNDPEIDPETGEPIPPYVPDPTWPEIPDPDDPTNTIPDPDAPLVPNPNYPEGPGDDQHDPSNPVPTPTVIVIINGQPTVINDPDNPASLYPITFDAVVIDAEDGNQTIYTEVQSAENSSEDEH